MIMLPEELRRTLETVGEVNAGVPRPVPETAPVAAPPFWRISVEPEDEPSHRPPLFVLSTAGDADALVASVPMKGNWPELFTGPMVEELNVAVWTKVPPTTPPATPPL